MFDWTAPSYTSTPRLPVRWVRCRKSRPCPICGHPDWCTLSDDGVLACCMRVSEGAFSSTDQGHGIGYFHKVDGSPIHAHEARVIPTPPGFFRFDEMLARWNGGDDVLQQFAADLGLEPWTLKALRVRYCDERKAWAFPMVDARGAVIGIRMRAGDRKWSMPGSVAGLFVPAMELRSKVWLICEGATDTAASLSLGYYAIGRPSCSGGAGHIIQMLDTNGVENVVIVADNDEPGMRGAKSLCKQLVELCETVKVITPTPHKDLRAARAAGWTMKDLTAAIETMAEDN